MWSLVSRRGTECGQCEPRAEGTASELCRRLPDPDDAAWSPAFKRPANQLLAVSRILCRVRGTWAFPGLACGKPCGFSWPDDQARIAAGLQVWRVVPCSRGELGWLTHTQLCAVPVRTPLLPEGRSTLLLEAPRMGRRSCRCPWSPRLCQSASDPDSDARGGRAVSSRPVGPVVTRRS